ncbi:YaaC family protein [Bacillus sp. FJAT-29790]|uniref:YaaC family protein n=1 Tax=Bacillus sp. FJAT-29790 TaxID=1895002 RepID=UPI001C23C051|nr:YaaC family protein [Bacillus sp. FJAT-29790]MBU8881456.1 YaaC family protein [Bacillus sp. FJAT-29790]
MLFPYNNWDSFLSFFSASSTQSYLKNCYQLQTFELAEQKSYENSYPFIYYLEHGQVYYKQAETAPLIIQPILLFYGLVHLIKACILTVDPNYPETTSVLAHGVSTRKRKKQHYCFFQDEVKFQKSGLFPYIGEKMFHMKHLEAEKATMRDLLEQIPELNQMFIQTEGKNTFVSINQQEDLFSLPKSILDNFHMTESRFIDYWQSKSSSNIIQQSSEGKLINFKLNHLHSSELLPIKYNLENNKLHFPSTKSQLNNYPELLIHYLLLYNLSMIARYETEWWSELIKMMPNLDYPFIQSFLHITARKGPFLIYQYLKK